jgi:acyl carrier protein
MTSSPGGTSSVASTLKDYIMKEIAMGTDRPEITQDTKLIESGILDSLSVLKLVTFIEERFKIRVEPDDVVADNFGTLSSISRYVNGKLANRP